MAGDFRIYYSIGSEEYSIEQWLEIDDPTPQSKEVITAVMDVVPQGKAPSISRVVDLGVDGKPMLVDEFLVTRPDGLKFGLIYRQLGHEEWFYLADATMYKIREGTKITGTKVTVSNLYREEIPSGEDFPVVATIDWDNLSLKYGDKELYMEPTSP